MDFHIFNIVWRNFSKKNIFFTMIKKKFLRISEKFLKEKIVFEKNVYFATIHASCIMYQFLLQKITHNFL